MTRETSARHSEILNDYKGGASVFAKWADENLGHVRLLDWSWGRISMHWDIDERFVMPDGVMFGGHVASMADHIVGLASMTVLTEEKERFRTSRLETNYFRPVMRPAATIEGRITNASKTFIHAEADILTPDGKLAVRINAVQVRRKTG